MAGVINLVTVMINQRKWRCPNCSSINTSDHDLDDLANLVCRNCDRVVLGRLLWRE